MDDALAGAAFLRERRDIDPAKIGIIGHSEGGIVAPLAAAKSPEVAFIVLLAGVGVPVEDLLVRQGEDIARVMGVAADITANNVAVQREVFRMVRAEPNEATLKAQLAEVFDRAFAALPEEQRQAIGDREATRAAQIQTICTPWFRKLLAYDPHPALAAVKCPVLASMGTRTCKSRPRRISTRSARRSPPAAIKTWKPACCPDAITSSKNARRVPSPSMARLRETFDPEALKLISDWIPETSRRRGAVRPESVTNSRRVIAHGAAERNF